MVELERAVSDLVGQAVEAKRALALRAGGYVRMLDAGFAMEPGALTASVYSRSIAWRAEYEKLTPVPRPTCGVALLGPRRRGAPSRPAAVLPEAGPASREAADAVLAAMPRKLAGKRLVISGTEPEEQEAA